MDYSVPSYLIPPTQLQSKQLDLMKTRQWMEDNEAQAKAKAILRRQVGFTRMKQQTADLMSQGLDPDLARKTALLENAPLIFNDDPRAYSQLVQSDEANQIRAQANQMLNESRLRFDDRMRARDAEIAQHNRALEEAKQKDTETRAESERLKNELGWAKMEKDFDAKTMKMAEKGVTLSPRDRLTLNDLFKRRFDVEKKMNETILPKMKEELKQQFDILTKQIDTFGSQPASTTPSDPKDPLGIRGILK